MGVSNVAPACLIGNSEVLLQPLVALVVIKNSNMHGLLLTSTNRQQGRPHGTSLTNTHLTLRDQGMQEQTPQLWLSLHQCKVAPRTEDKYSKGSMTCIWEHPVTLARSLTIKLWTALIRNCVQLFLLWTPCELQTFVTDFQPLILDSIKAALLKLPHLSMIRI